MAFPTGWTRYCPLVIQHGQVTANQTLAVVFTESCLPAEMLTTGDSHESQANGGDIRFTTDTAGLSQLSCEVVVWTKNANPLLAKAEVWVPVAVSSSVDTTIYIWYHAGGSEVQPAAGASFGRNSVWDSNYQGGVAHFPDGTTLSAFDSTGNNTFTNAGSSLCVAASGIFGGSAYSDATGNPTGQHIDLGSLPTVFDGVGHLLMVEYWIYANQPTTVNRSNCLGSSRTGNNTVRCYFGNDGTSNAVQVLVNWGSWANNFKYVRANGTTLTSGTWFHVAMHIDVATLANSKVYVNGSLVTSGTGTNGSPLSVLPTLPSAANLFMQDSNERFDGRIDEFRMSIIERSATYVSTTYNNQNAPASFTVAGTPVSPGGGGIAKGSPLCGVNPLQGFIG